MPKAWYSYLQNHVPCEFSCENGFPSPQSAWMTSFCIMAQMKAIVKELRGSFPTLLRSKRGGVVSAALAAAARTGTGQVDLSKALAAALRDLPGNQQAYSLHPTDPSSLFPSSLMLDLAVCHILLSVLFDGQLTTLLPFCWPVNVINYPSKA